MATTDLLPLDDVSACRRSRSRESMASDQAEHLASRLKALADPARLRLLSMVSAHDDNEACVCDLTEPLGLSQPTVSHHLKVLVDAGYLSRSQRGRWAYYRLVEGALDDITSALAALSPARAADGAQSAEPAPASDARAAKTRLATAVAPIPFGHPA